ncbi:MAG TPA: ABC transporter substrate-binding protein [Streptosporangiaceae bacterium]|nr:ABC transporter substrate-binding protein [Streptosporangiaceae bacterium]
MRRLFSRRIAITATLGAAALLAAACGSSSSGGSGSGSSASGSLFISNAAGTTWTCQFDPYNPTYQGLSFGPVYEPLMYADSLLPGPAGYKLTPMLATGYTWSNGTKTLTFNIRQGVKFSNGTPLTAADVAFTFNMMKKYPGTDFTSLWAAAGGPLTGVVAKGDQVVITMSRPGPYYFYYIADQVPIVPMSIWSHITNPATVKDTTPVGTGPYTVGACSGQNIQYKANPHYWQPGKPKVETVNFPAYLSNTPANQCLSSGQCQWGAQYIPGIQHFYLSRSPDNHYWFPAISNVSVVINLTKPLLNNVAVRQAMAYAINRPQVSQLGESGYEPAANQTDILTTSNTASASWYDAVQAARYGNDYAYNPAKAEQILSAAGFQPGQGGVRQNSKGQKLSFTIVNNNGYSDWENSIQVIISDLAKVGIQVTAQNVAYSTYTSDLQQGTFELGYYAQTGGPTPVYEMRQWLLSGNSAKIGQTAPSNFGRYTSKSTDALFTAYGNTTVRAVQQSIVNKLQNIMLAQVPFIPVTEQVDWDQYSTAQFTGWPTQANPYALPSQYQAPDWEQTLLNLVPKK